jgi:glycosidase
MRAVLLALVLTPLAAFAEPPSVAKVDPPGWWVGHTVNPVRLLLRGHGLAGARVTSATPGVTIGVPRVSASGTTLFVDVTLAPSARAGVRTLRVSTPGGATDVPFDVMPRQTARPAGFSADDVVYLIMPDRFGNGDPSNDDPAKAPGLLDRAKTRFYHGGDLKGVTDHLPYLKELGVTTVWMTPVYDNADHINERETYDGQPVTDYHGYGAVDFYGVDEHLGDMAALRALVDRAHALGLKVVQDQVANHTGPYHPWVQDPPTPTWWNGTQERHLANTWQIWTLGDPHGTTDTGVATEGGWFAGILPDLNQGDPEVARYVIQNSLWWVGMAGFDGIRQDTLPYVPRAFWRDWTAALRRQHPTLRVLGEVYDGDPAIVSYYQGGARGIDGVDTGISSLFDFPLFYPLRRAFAEGKAVREVASMLAHDRLYPAPEQLAPFLGVHDMQRFLNEPGASVAGLKLALTFLATTRGMPILYYGDEIAMRGGGDPDNRRDFPGGFPGDTADAFTIEGRTPEQEQVHAHVKQVLALRRELAPLRQGRLLNLLVDEQAYVYARTTKDGVVLVAFNNDTKPAELDVPVSAVAIPDGARLVDRLGALGASHVAGGRLRLSLPPRTAAILVPAR